MITLAGDDDMYRWCVWVATAGLVAMTSLSLAGGAARAEPLANSAAALAPIGNEWWSGGGKVQRQVWPVDQRIVATAVAAGPTVATARSAPRAATSATGRPGPNRSWLGQLVLIAVAVVAVGAFTVLQLRAWSRRRRSPSGRSRDIYDWRTLPPPPPEDDPGPGEMPFGQQESYGPLWRYGAPRGYLRDYEPGCEPTRGPGFARDSDAGPGPGDSPGSAGSGPGPGRGSSSGPGPGFGPGYDPGFGPGARLPWGVPGDVPRDRRP